MTNKQINNHGLTTFQKDGQYGLKNSSDITVVEPIYDEIHISADAIVASRFELDQEDEEKKVLDILNLSGRIDLEATKKLSEHDIHPILEFWPLGSDLFGFQYSNWDSLELTGVFNAKGQLVISPDYDEVELISDHLLLCFKGEHYEEYDSLGVKNYGQKLFNSDGQKLEAESISEFEELENGDFKFKTVLGEEFTLTKEGRKLK